MIIKKLLLSAVLTATALTSAIAQFEGVIEFKKMTTMDTTTYVYYVKGNKVRIDELNKKSKKVEGSFLIDLTANTMTSLSHDRKLYMEQKQAAAATIVGKPEVINTKQTKTVMGTACKEYQVNSKEEKTNIKYYVAGTNYDFFPKMLRLLNRKDKFSVYYLLLKEAGNGFPYLAIQTDDTGKETSRLEITKSEKKTIDANQFVIPKEYNKFEKN